ncbi:MAG: diguanylate cyclase (GGDEF)-like protein [Acidimicrobiales bacterium]|jgi:diguanylate cyclase (GGDEF)-like protein
MAFRRSIESDNPVADADDGHVDCLTGLPDRWQVETWVAELLVRGRRTGDRFGFFLVSVANLAEINSGYGSAVGDEVLQAVAESLEAAVGTRGSLARYLGSEFAVLWPGLFGANEANRVAVDLVASLPQQVTFERFVVPVEVAVAGVMSDPDLNERLLLVEAEATLAEARIQGHDRMLIRDEAYGVRRKPEVLAVRLQRAFENDEFQLYYQPIVSLTAGSLVGFEAMPRWLAPDAGPTGAEPISPGAFLDALRASPIVVPLHAWVLRECTRQVSSWSRRLAAPSLFGATNMDPSFVRDERFYSVVMQVIAEMNVHPTQVLLDINGSVAGPQIGQLWPQLARVKAEGVGIAMEDFGIGFGSPDLLRRCRFDVIRLPRVLVGGLGLAEEDKIIVSGLIRLAHDLGCYVIAEGVETEEQASLLREVGCDLAQGFLFGRPAPDSEVSRDLEDYVARARLAAGPRD